MRKIVKPWYTAKRFPPPRSLDYCLCCFLHLSNGRMCCLQGFKGVFLYMFLAYILFGAISTAHQNLQWITDQPRTNCTSSRT